jgi:hypothetical protein
VGKAEDIMKRNLRVLMSIVIEKEWVNRALTMMPSTSNKYRIGVIIVRVSKKLYDLGLGSSVHTERKIRKKILKRKVFDGLLETG